MSKAVTACGSTPRETLGCELAAEVPRSWGRLRLRATGASMLPAVWPGDALYVCRRSATQALPGDIIIVCPARAPVRPPSGREDNPPIYTSSLTSPLHELL